MATHSGPRIGVLALQGNFSSHHQRLTRMGASVLEVRTAKDLAAVSAIVLPGGESTAMLKLMDHSLQAALTEAIASGLPTLATCAGVILLAKRVTNPEQESFGLLDVDVERNAYGRQTNSFVDKTLTLTSEGRKILETEDALEGVFIRAPRISRVGSAVQVLVREGDDAVLVQQRNILAATFHPELAEGQSPICELFLRNSH